MKSLHQLQTRILEQLMYHDGFRHSHIKNHLDIASNHVSFHLQSLIDAWLVHKDEQHYSLTTEGKLLTNRFTEEAGTVVTQAKIFASIMCSRDTSQWTERLVFTRGRHPFKWCQGAITEKILEGETITHTAQRGLYKQTWLKGNATLISHCHILTFNNNDQGENNKSSFIDDKFFYMCHVHNPTGKQHGHEKGLYERYPEEQLQTFSQPFYRSQEFRESIQRIKTFTGNVTFYEEDRYTDFF